MNIIQRIKAPTPSFFAKLRNISLAIAAIGATISTAPIALPAIAIKVAGYLTVAGTVSATISQSVTNGEGVGKVKKAANGKQHR